MRTTNTHDIKVNPMLSLEEGLERSSSFRISENQLVV